MIELSTEQIMVIFKYNHSHVLSQQLQLIEVLHAVLVRLSYKYSVRGFQYNIFIFMSFSK